MRTYRRTFSTCCPKDQLAGQAFQFVSSSRGGSGASLSKEAVEAAVDSWAEQGAGAAFGGADATHFGFAAVALDNGQTTAVAIFGGQG